MSGNSSNRVCLACNKAGHKFKNPANKIRTIENKLRLKIIKWWAITFNNSDGNFGENVDACKNCTDKADYQYEKSDLNFDSDTSDLGKIYFFIEFCSNQF